MICLGVLLELMTGVCDPVVLNGECGYYLTVLGAALSVRPPPPSPPRSALPPTALLTRMPPQFIRGITAENVAQWERERCGQLPAPSEGVPPR